MILLLLLSAVSIIITTMLTPAYLRALRNYLNEDHPETLDDLNFSFMVGDIGWEEYRSRARILHHRPYDHTTTEEA